MFTLCVKDSFAAAHRLVGYQGRCEELHGHNFIVEAFFSGEKLGDDGLLVDFKILKNHLKEVLDKLDHKYLNELSFFVEKTSSAENIALYIFGEMEKKMQGTEVFLKKIRVWESDKAYAAYER
jgi:6-pyruvoyltetrahydropterin/6-carboxytetrahydropterin synthase